MACIALADYLSSMWIFGASEPVAGKESISMVEQIINELITKSEADESERAWEWLPDWLAANENRFMGGAISTKNMGIVLGYKDGGYVYIIKTELNKALREEGFNPNKVLGAWADSGKIPCDMFANHRKLGVRSKREINNSRPYVICIKPEV